MTDRCCAKRRHFLNTAVVAAVSASSSLAVGAQESLKASEHKPDANALADFSNTARGIERLHSVVVSSGTDIVLSESFRGPGPDRAVNVKSVSKSLVSTLVGAAVQRGIIESVEQTLGELVPEMIPQASDPQAAQLTVEDLLTMRAGLERVSGPAYGRWVNSNHWIDYALTRPFIAKPGTRMLYSTGNTHVLGAVLTSLTNNSLHSLANSWLGKPLGFTFAPWTRDPQGFYLGGNEMSVSPENLAKVGALYLADGAYEGQHILSTEWVDQAFTARTRSPFSGDGYGYGWFKRDLGGVTSAYARGYGGQLMHVIPERKLVVVITSSTTQRARSNGYMKVLHDLVEQHLV